MWIPPQDLYGHPCWNVLNTLAAIISFDELKLEGQAGGAREFESEVQVPTGEQK